MDFLFAWWYLVEILIFILGLVLFLCVCYVLDKNNFTKIRDKYFKPLLNMFKKK